jgi:hypothetical protein
VDLVELAVVELDQLVVLVPLQADVILVVVAVELVVVYHLPQ